MSGPTLTEADLRAAMEELLNRPIQVCSHVVHPKATGWTICANCFQPVEVER